MPFSSNDAGNYVAVGRQSAAGADDAASFKFLRFLNENAIDAELDAGSAYEGGGEQDESFHWKRGVKADGEIEVFARPDQFTYLAAYAMGAGLTPASTGGMASHCYTPNATLPNLTIEQAFAAGGQIERVTDAQFAGFTIEAEAQEPWKINVPFIGGGTFYWRDGAASALSPALEAADPAMFAGGAYLINGATSLDIRKWTVNFERKMDDDLYTVNMFRRGVVALTRNVTLNAEVIYQNASHWARVHYGLAGATMPSLVLASGAFQARAVMASSQMVGVDLPNLRHIEAKINRLNPDGETLILNLSAKGIKAGTSIMQLRSNILGVPTSYLQ